MISGARTWYSALCLLHTAFIVVRCLGMDVETRVRRWDAWFRTGVDGVVCSVNVHMDHRCDLSVWQLRGLLVSCFSW